jgi:hypothetical protein
MPKIDHHESALSAGRDVCNVPLPDLNLSAGEIVAAIAPQRARWVQ